MASHPSNTPAGGPTSNNQHTHNNRTDYRVPIKLMQTRVSSGNVLLTYQPVARPDHTT
jgi:hypothetical protein